MAISNTHIKQLQLGTDQYYISAKYLLDQSNLEHSYEDIKQLIDEAASMHNLELKVVSTLPVASINTLNAIYLVPETITAEQNIYGEYITVKNGSVEPYTYSWEKIGTTSTDLSDYSLNTHYHTGTPTSITLTATATGTSLSTSSENFITSVSNTSNNMVTTSVVNAWSASVDANGVLSFSTNTTTAATGSISSTGTGATVVQAVSSTNNSALTAASVNVQPTIKINNENSVNVASANTFNTSAAVAAS